MFTIKSNLQRTTTRLKCAIGVLRTLRSLSKGVCLLAGTQVILQAWRFVAVWLRDDATQAMAGFNRLTCTSSARMSSPALAENRAVAVRIVSLSRRRECKAPNSTSRTFSPSVRRLHGCPKSLIQMMKGLTLDRRPLTLTDEHSNSRSKRRNNAMLSRSDRGSKTWHMLRCHSPKSFSK